MSVNGAISKRLDTSLGLLATGPATLGSRLKEAGQTARASVDVNFSRQLTQAQLQEARDDKLRSFELEDAETARIQQQESEDRALRLKTQLYATGIAVEAGQQSGDWSALKNMVDSDAIDPVIKPQMEMLANAAVPQGLDWALKQGEILIKARNASSAELANTIRQKGLDERTRNNMRRLFLDKQKFDFERAQADLEQAIANDDAGVIKDFFASSPMVPEGERQGWEDAVKGEVSGAQAINVMNKFLDEQRQLAVQESRNAESAGKTPQDYKLFKDVRDDYQNVSKPLREELKIVADIENILAQPQDAVTDKALTAKVSQLFGKNVRAMAELNEWKSLGNLGQRVVGGFSRFFTGKRTESVVNDMRRLVSNYKVDLERAHNLERARAYDNLVDYGSGRVDPGDLFPDATTRFQEKAGEDGKIYIVDTWLRTFRPK